MQRNLIGARLRLDGPYATMDAAGLDEQTAVLDMLPPQRCDFRDPQTRTDSQRNHSLIRLREHLAKLLELLDTQDDFLFLANAGTLDADQVDRVSLNLQQVPEHSAL